MDVAKFIGFGWAHLDETGLVNDTRQHRTGDGTGKDGHRTEPTIENQRKSNRDWIEPVRIDETDWSGRLDGFSMYKYKTKSLVVFCAFKGM